MIDAIKKIIDDFPDLLILSDFNGKLLDVSKNVVDLYGATSKEELLGKRFFDFLSADQLPIAVENFKKSQNLGFFKNREYKIKKKDGSFIWGELNAQLYKKKDGKTECFLIVLRDITAKKLLLDELNDSKRMFQLVLDNIPQFIYWKDKDSKYLGCNKNFARVAGVGSPDNIVGKTDFELAWKQEEAESFYETDKLVLDTNKPEYHIVESQLQASGKTRWIDTNKVPLHNSNGDVVGIMATYEDITERVDSEISLKKSEEKYRTAYNRANFLKDLFSHDITNFLQGILTATELNEFYLKNRIDQNIPEVLKIIKIEIERATRLVNNIRKLSNVEEEEIPLKKIDSCKILASAQEKVLSQFPNRKILLSIDSYIDDAIVNANDLLFDVFENILNNSIKHNFNEPVEILVKISKINKVGLDFVKFEFKDNGVGVVDASKETLFERVYNKEKSITGLGLGLSLTKKIVESYKGKIWVEDKILGNYSKGSNFVVLIPMP